MTEISYYLDEVEFFHPAVIEAFQKAIAELNLSNVLRIDHHLQLENGSIPDLCLIRLSDEKIIMPIEVKRTPADVRTTGRRQAQDYAVNLGGRAVDGYYCSTNLELFELFKATSGQKHERILLLHGECGRFVDGTDAVRQKAIVAAKEIITLALRNLGVAADTVGAMRDDIMQVGGSSHIHSILSGISYEFVRGAFSKSSKLIDRLSAARLLPLQEYRHSLSVLKDSLNRIDFAMLFSDGAIENHVRLPSISSQEQAFRAGKESRIEDILELIEDKILEFDSGFVETDNELARSLAHLTRAVFPVRDRSDVWDPGAGSGRLLKAAYSEIPDVSLNNLVATEIIPVLGELLTINLGLLDPSQLSPLNAPKIEIMDVCDKMRDEVLGVGLVLMNPPFVAHVRSVKRQEQFRNKIEAVLGVPSRVASGQIGLEALFLELITALVPAGTIIASIFPHQSLSRRSSGFTRLRKFLIRDFGLKAIFDYPHTALFEGKTKQTCIIIGKTGSISSTVDFLQTSHDVSRLNYEDFVTALVGSSGKISHVSLPTGKLISAIGGGWRKFFPGAPLLDAATQSYTSTISMEEANYAIRRGKFGNSGSTKTFRKDPDDCKREFSFVPQAWWKHGINNVGEGKRIMSSTNVRGRCFVPPKEALDSSSSDFKLASRFIELVYPEGAPEVATTQAGRKKSVEDRLADLLRDSEFFEGPMTLIPRAMRQDMEIFLILDKIIPSTNFVCVQTGHLDTQELFSSWLLSVFAQVQLERLSSSENGMRKIEVGTIRQLEIPNFETIDHQVQVPLRALGATSNPLRSSALVRRELDEEWAKVLYPSRWEEMLTTAFIDLVRLINERRP